MMTPKTNYLLPVATALAVSAGLTSAATINIVGDSTTTDVPSKSVGPDSAIGNGDFEAQTGNPLTFAQVSNWFNLAGDETTNFGRSNGTNGSPQTGSQGAQLSGTTFPANDTGYTIATAGEAFSTSLYLGQFGGAGNYATDTTVTVSLFTSATGVNDATVVGDITVLGSVDFTPFDPAASSFAMSFGNDFYTSVEGDVGKTVYVGIELTDEGNNAFPRTDTVSLSVETIPEPSVTLIAGLGALLAVRRKRH